MSNMLMAINPKPFPSVSVYPWPNALKSNQRGYAAAGLEASLHNLLTSARLWRVLTHCTWENTTVAISKCGSKVGR